MQRILKVALKRGLGYFTVKKMNSIKFRNYDIDYFFFQNENEVQKLSLSKPKDMKISKYEQHFQTLFVYFLFY